MSCYLILLFAALLLPSGVFAHGIGGTLSHAEFTVPEATAGQTIQAEINARAFRQRLAQVTSIPDHLTQIPRISITYSPCELGGSVLMNVEDPKNALTMEQLQRVFSAIEAYVGKRLRGKPPAVAATAMAGFERLSRELLPNGQVPERVRRILTEVIRPKVVFRDATTTELLEYLERLDKRVSVVTHPPAKLSVVGLEVTNISQMELINYVCDVTNLYWRFTSKGIEIGPRESLTQ